MTQCYRCGLPSTFPIALGVLAASGQLGQDGMAGTMVLGELDLGGAVRPVNGVLSAVGTGLEAGLATFLVPRENLREARALGRGRIRGIGSLREAALAVGPGGEGPETPGERGFERAPSRSAPTEGSLDDIRGHDKLKRAVEIAAAGRHHLLLFGLPGSGKTMSARILPGLLPQLTREEALAVTRIHSIAGVLPPEAGLITRPPFRAPHHSASNEGIIGGGRFLRPGEVSLAHHGILFLDEAPEFGMSLLQGLREPVEDGWVSIARAGSTARFPADCQLVLAFNPCPCRNMGRDGHRCRCTDIEVMRYWRKVGGALLDRIDMRIPLAPVPSTQMCKPIEKGNARSVAERVARVIDIQRERYAGLSFSINTRIPPGLIDRFCPLSPVCVRALAKAAEKHALSSRAFHSVLRIARTIADLAGEPDIREEDLEEALQHRRYGDNDFFWTSS